MPDQPQPCPCGDPSTGTGLTAPCTCGGGTGVALNARRARPALDLDAIEQREQAATEGSWFLHPDWPGRVFSDDQFNVHIARCTGTRPEANAAFLAAARTDVPALVDAVRQRDADLALLRSAAQSAAVLLRSIDANANAGRPQDIGAIRAAARALDDTATPAPSA